jgi:quercetin dioxygenase-like cupin family protein
MHNLHSVTFIPWESTEPPSESVIRSILAEENLKPYAWGNNPGDVYQAHTHGFDKVIYVIQGSITFGLPEDGQQVTLKAGDRLELPAGTQHNATVGEHGVRCLEAHR